MKARVDLDGNTRVFEGKWIHGTPWQRFGLYNSYVVIRADGRMLKIPAHAGELAPGSTEDLIAAIASFDSTRGYPSAPLSLELDPTYRCASRDCGGACFSAGYRALAPTASLPVQLLKEIINDFALNGGRIVRFDGGGDPLLNEGVRSGEIVEFASRLGLKTTILTAGDFLDRSNLDKIAETGCYVRVSLNAATDATRTLFHGNSIPLGNVMSAVKRLVGALERVNPETPVGSTFLLSHLNYREVRDCALMARDAGIRHFSVRRILGPEKLRPIFSRSHDEELQNLLMTVESLHSNDFRVAVPWRSVAEPDLNPRQFCADRCWQSTFKTVIEPAQSSGHARVQLCGRYRGNGFGQEMQMQPLSIIDKGDGWIKEWQKSFSSYPISRRQLLTHCVSCIDRGFILLLDRLMNFLQTQRRDYRILHLDSPRPFELEEC
jgi:MoaA/NifB/PqqE/SkfB family radical SAM enzyme